MYSRNNNYGRSSNGNNRSQGGKFYPAMPSKRKFNQIFNPRDLVSSEMDKVSPVEYSAKHSFKDFLISEKLIENIFAKGYTTPTPIQDQAIQPILEGRDLIGIANTGTGKTAAFLIPLIDKVLKNRQEKVLIVAPTRELAVQIRDEFVSFAKGLDIHAVLCIGGVKIFRQKQDLKYPYNFVIGTPGRLKDLIREKSINASLFTNVVLDETDHMVDIGFIHDIKFIVSYLPKKRQSLFFSATVDEKVKDIIRTFVQNPVTVSVKTKETSENIEQTVVRVIDKHKKIDQLHDLLIQKEFEKVLIFGRTKWGVQKLSNELVKRGFRADAIHGNKQQNQRQRTLDRFKRNEISILLATDVASRGLDIDNVTHVINYDMPASRDDYIHRIGRTGRAEKKGVALTFVE